MPISVFYMKYNIVTVYVSYGILDMSGSSNMNSIDKDSNNGSGIVIKSYYLRVIPLTSKAK